MKKFLLATTASAVVLGACGLAYAQTDRSEKSGAQTQMAPSTRSEAPSTSSTSSGSANHTMTTGQSSTSTGTSSSTQTNPPAAGSSGSTTSSGANAPAQAQSNTTSQTPATQAQQSPSGAATSSSAQKQPSTSTNTAQQPANNTNTAQRPSGNSNTNTAQQPSGNSNVNTVQQPSGNAKTNTAQQPSTNTNTAQRPSSKESTSTAERPSGTNTAESGAGASDSVNIGERERTRVSQTFAKLDVRPVTNVNFKVSVGTVVPRDIRLETVPSDVVEIVPQFRGYKFFAVREEIVIVEPSSLKIVAVLPRSGGGSASVTSERKSKFSEEDRALMRKHVHVRAEARAPATTGSSSRTTTTVTIGERVPDSVEIRSFPDEVYRDAPRLKEYRYIEEGDRAYVVEPSDRRVIEEIE